MTIAPAVQSDLEAFFTYIDQHLSESGTGDTPVFQPTPKSQQGFPAAGKQTFITGLGCSQGDKGWRKLWLAKDDANNIIGHADIRYHGDGLSFHRVLLGMGVDSSIRKSGLGTRLLNTVIAFCQENPEIEWLDLSVLSENTPARNLYLKSGFSVTGEVRDRFRVDGRSISDTTMTLNVKMDS